MPVYKDKDRNSWFFRVYVYINGSKVQKKKCGFKTKSAAKLAEIDFINKYNNINNIYPEDITFQELFDIFIKWKYQNLKPQSYRTLLSRFNNYVLPFFKNYKLNQINDKLYIEWKEYIIKKNFSYKYNSSLHSCMVSILNYAIEFYGLEKNVAAKIGNFSKNDDLSRVDFWTYDEFNQFINYVDDNLYKILYHTLFFTGLRLGECLALNWNDIKEDYIIINKTIAKGKKDGNYIITSPKTSHSNRIVKIDKMTINLLLELKEYYQRQIGFSESWFVFGGIHPLSQTTVGRKKNEYCKKANVKQIKIHDFRHSHATFLLSKGLPIILISKRLGHSSVAMTLDVYSHLVPADEDKAIIIINNLF